MEFNFIDYHDDLFEKSITSTPAAIYVFDNFENLRFARKYYDKPFLEQESIFITMSDFKEKLFPVDRIVLKEEKLSVIFYELLTETEKEQLQINNYFDAIELANEFFNFYSELKEYKVKEITDLKEWQQYKYDLFQQLRFKYIKHMAELGYTDRTLIYDFTNFSPQFIHDYDNINFINLINFTPMEKDVLSQLEKNHKNITINLQLAAANYDQEHLTLKSVGFPDNHNTKIHLFQMEEDLLQLVNLIDFLENDNQIVNDNDDNHENINIIDANYDNSNYKQLLSSTKVVIDQEISFKQTKIYRFLNTLYKLIKNSNIDHGHLILQLEDLLDACYLEEFSQYYQVPVVEAKEGLINLIEEDFVYLSRELLEKKNLIEFVAVWEDIMQIKQFKNLVEFCDFLENINLKILNDEKYDKNIARFFDALLELKSLEEMNIVSNWNHYFNNKTISLFYLILRYLQFKKVVPVNTADNDYIIEPLLRGKHCQRDNLFILNVSTGIIPATGSSGFLLTDKQRENQGLPSILDKRLLQKYYFCRHLFSSKSAYLFSIKKMDSNITASPFLEELRLKYDLQFQEPVFKAKHYSEIVTNIFNTDSNLFKTDLYPELIKDDKLVISENDFPDKGFSISYYKYKTLKICYYRFYLEHIAGLDTEQLEFKKEMDLKVLGIMVHEIIEEISTLISPGDFDIDKKTIRQISEQIFWDYNLKFNNFYQKYYRKILLPVMQNSMIKFFEKISKKTGDVDKLVTEWQPTSKHKPIFMENNITDIYLNGRLDLLINTPHTTHIIDFKTGGGDLDQLDFYALILKPLLTSELEKSIYYIFSEKFTTARSGSEEKFAHKLSSALQQFLDSGEYRKVFKSYCQRCDYYDICRVVVS